MKYNLLTLLFVSLSTPLAAMHKELKINGLSTNLSELEKCSYSYYNKTIQGDLAIIDQTADNLVVYIRNDSRETADTDLMIKKTSNELTYKEVHGDDRYRYPHILFLNQLRSRTIDSCYCLDGQQYKLVKKKDQQAYIRDKSQDTTSANEERVGSAHYKHEGLLYNRTIVIETKESRGAYVRDGTEGVHQAWPSRSVTMYPEPTARGILLFLGCFFTTSLTAGVFLGRFTAP